MKLLLLSKLIIHAEVLYVIIYYMSQ